MKKRSFHKIEGFCAEDFTPGDLKITAAILDRYNVEKIRFSSGGRLSVSGISGNQLRQLSCELEIFPQFKTENGITYIHYCPGHDQCKYGIIDGKDVAERLGKLTFTPSLDTKVKVAIAACRMCCTEPYVRDVGLIAAANGWQVLFGGNGGSRPRIADMVADQLTAEQAIELVRRCLLYYQHNRGSKIRTARFMETVGCETLRNAVLADPL